MTIDDPRMIKLIAASNAKAKKLALERALLEALRYDFNGDIKRFEEEKAEIINLFEDAWEDVRRERQKLEQEEFEREQEKLR